MSNHFHTPSQIVDLNIQSGVAKTNITWSKLILLGILAGVCIAFGAQGSSVAMHGVANVGLSRLVGGAVFPVGLMMIVFTGGELFTGDCLLFMNVLDRKVKVSTMMKKLVAVYASNLIGAVLVAALVYLSGQWDYSEGALGAFTIKVALGKTNLSFVRALTSGVLCNVMVCMAVLMAAAAKDIAGKVWAVFFPIMAFVVSGFEHCVANMYYIPAGIFAAGHAEYVQKAEELYGITDKALAGLNWGTFAVNNLIPVTLGNMIGGMLCVGGLFYVIHKNPKINRQ